MKLKYYNMLASVLLMVSCEKELPEVDAPDFNVTTKSTTYKAGDKITFNVTGDADIVAFYSGELFKEYAYKDGRVIDATNAGATVSFMSAVTGGTQGTLSATLPPHISVMASTEFNGQYNIQSVQAASAKWEDITPRFRYSTSATFVTSTEADISDLQVAGKPLYIAFKYVTQPQATNGVVRQWQIEKFLVNSKKDIGGGVKPNITDIVSTGFQLIDQNPGTAPARSVLTASRLTLWGNLYNAVNDPTNDPSSENWAVSRPIFTNSIDLGPDRSVAIKDHDRGVVFTEYIHTYAQPGTYKATFVASNNNLNDRKEVVREIVITVTP